MSQATHGWVIGDNQGLVARIGGWFRKNQIPGEEQPLDQQENLETESLDTEPAAPEVPVAATGGGGGHEPRFILPWAKRDQAIDNLHRGIGALSELLVSIRDNMERQSARQQELLGHLASLPDVLRQIPESNRVHGETLQAIHYQIERQNTQQSKLGDILERITQADDRQGRTLDALQQTVSAISTHDEAISGNLQTLGFAMESISNNSQSSAQVLEQMRDTTARREGELERVIRRQNTRFTTLLTIAIVLSVGALTAVSVFGYLAYDTMMKIK